MKVFSGSSYMQPLFKNITHLGLVVRDVYKTADDYIEKFGIGPWSI